jgi:dTMP kinase
MKKEMLSKFITIEGIEGAGKTTAMSFIKTWLEEKKIPFITTREPGGTEIAEEIRHILLRHHHESLTDMTELLLFFAGRAQHLDTTILPALENGQWVICDRFVDASFAYQGGGRKIPLLFLECLEKYVLKGKQPDLTILLDLPVEVGMSRIKARNKHDRIEQEKELFFKTVRQMYLKRAEQFAQRFQILNANCSINVMKNRLYTILDNFFKKQR